ncbi:hypothetical protein RO3G_04427 [Rhizopus delemar RA 99-880]|uniref:Uncharacterized protein n=1 Tax=Rhizopus delemar (strain RA 99-880 / ATCC MYA-4621 / FGSC 9543 / NRRL 43880) TaxID=246409 RepID=I1BU42_RHIO9|nr:hypothetical protein RO3G_04427 [Rhizopus delemar RA 99-880]|eukprot:EIE79722.1 hypothetical protein RO3G_04427 [Rhizopus delemar RA 99-880]
MIFLLAKKTAITSSWLEEETLARKIVHSNAGVVEDVGTRLSSIIQGFKKLKDVEELPVSLTVFAKYVLAHYKRPATKQRFQNHLKTALDRYSVENAREQATNNILKESYRIYDNLSTVTADNIIKSATSPKGEDIEEGYESDGSCKSEDYHPRRTRSYSVDIVCEDNESAEDTPMMKELRDFRRRSVELTKRDVNQVSDLRLLSLDFIYLFSENIEKSVTKYLGTEAHLSSIPLFSSGKPNDINPIVFKWCMQLTNFKFEDNNDKWMELQKATIAILGEAITKYDKAVVQIANLLHTVSVSIFYHYFRANGRLNQVDQNGKFKPDYIAYVKTRSTRHDLTIAEVKPTGASLGKPPSDLVKLGQQMKLMLNNLISNKIPSSVVCGILVEGKNCSLYKMDIIGHSFYRMVLIASFPLCTTPSELCLIPNMFLWMTYLKKYYKDITIDTAKQIEKSELAKAKDKI